MHARSKNKARISDYEKLAAQNVKVEENSLDIQIQPGPPLGEKVVVAENLQKGYGDNLLHRRTQLRNAARRGGRTDRAQRHRQDYPVPHDRR